MTKNQWSLIHSWHRFLLSFVEIVEGLVLVATLGTVHPWWSGELACRQLKWCVKRMKEDLK